jgi:hypothetical protein
MKIHEISGKDIYKKQAVRTKYITTLVLDASIANVEAPFFSILLTF